MTPAKLLQQAKNEPEKRDLTLYTETVWELKRKGKSYRQIAEFLNERGVLTDHMAVYRLIAADNPLLGYDDGRLLIGDVEYEARKGRPLRPFSAGLFVNIEKRMQILPIQRELGVCSTWCEAQFELDSVPNHCWLEQLCKCLHIDWNPENPCHLQSRLGFEIKFEADIMAMVCRTFNLENSVRDLETAVGKTTEFFRTNKEWMTRTITLREQQRREALDALLLPPGSSTDEEFEESKKWSNEEAERLTKRFKSLPT
jgi:hypothetical protein